MVKPNEFIISTAAWRETNWLERKFIEPDYLNYTIKVQVGAIEERAQQQLIELGWTPPKSKKENPMLKKLDWKYSKKHDRYQAQLLGIIYRVWWDQSHWVAWSSHGLNKPAGDEDSAKSMCQSDARSKVQGALA